MVGGRATGRVEAGERVCCGVLMPCGGGIVLQYVAFGGLIVGGAGGQRRLAATKQRSVLAVLLARANAAVPVDELVHQVWGDAAPRTVRNVLQWYVSRLRAMLRPGVLVWNDRGYRLAVAPGEFDVHEFERLAADGLAALADEKHAAARADLAEALAISSGPAYADVAPVPLVEAEAGRLAQRRHAVHIGRMRADLALGRYQELVPELTALVDGYPFDEELQYLFGAALYGTGRAADALAHCRRVRRVLADDLGIEPGQQLRELELTILRRLPVPERAADGPVDVGAKPSQLPPDVADFVGRGPELDRLLTVLGSGARAVGPPVALIAGEPGIGKSALAVHAAHRLRHRYPDGQIYLDLKGGEIGALDPFDALGQVLSSLGVRQSVVPPMLQSRSAMLRTLLADRRILLVLDNVSATVQVHPLLPNSAGCGVLVTARGPLTGLATTRPVELRCFDRAESVELLARIVGADRVAAEPRPAAEVAGLLGGLPLAVRIAGARLAAHPHRRLSWLARRLADERHRLDELVAGDLALRRSLELSYRTLHPAQQRALRLLSLLEVPDFAPWLAAAALDGPVEEVEDLLEGLVEARLLAIAPGGDPDVVRFRFHQLVRVYGRELARAHEPAGTAEAALVRAYGACLTAAERMDRELRRTDKLARGNAPRTPVGRLDPADPLRWFEAERGALTAAVRHAAAAGQVELAWELAATLERFLEVHNHIGDWLAVTETGLSAARQAGDPSGEACLLRSLGEAYAVEDRMGEAVACFAQSRELFASAGNDRGAAHALGGVSYAQRVMGQYADSIAAAEAALEIFADRPDPAGEAAVWQSLGAAHHDLRQLDRAEGCWTEALRRYAEIGDLMNQTVVLCNAGTLYTDTGRFVEAERCLAEAAELAQRCGFANGQLYATIALGRLKLGQDAPAEAEPLLRTALGVAREIADRYGEATALRLLGTALRLLGETERAACHLDAAVALFKEIEMPLKTAESLVQLAETHLAAGRPDQATGTWREALDIYTALDAPDAAVVARRIADVERQPAAL
jgi:DNA-binding SARP family transcriptional activator